MPADMPAEQGAPQQQDGAQRPAAQIVADVNSGMSQLLEMLVGNPQMKEDASKLQQIMGAYQQFVQGLGQAPGQGQPEAQAPGGPMPANGGPGTQPAM